MASVGYTRQSSFVDGDTINADLFNLEYNKLVNAFAYSSTGTTGHQHDGTGAEGGNIPQIGDQDFNNKIVVDSSNNRWGVFVEVSSNSVEQIRIQDGAIVPVTDNDIDLGTSSLQFKDAFFDGTVEADAITINGTTLAETISDTVGAMVGSNTETGISVTYDDSDNTLDFVIGADSIVSSMLDTNIDIAGTLDVTGVLTADTNATIAGTLGISGGSTNGVQISQGAISIKNGGAQSYVDFYCESSNAHYARLQAPAHSAFSGNITATLPVTTGTLALTSDIHTTEELQDIIGAMFSSNTESGITATYQDSDGTIDLTVGNAATATALETARTIHGVSFNGTANIDLTEVVQDTVGAMFSSNTETGITATYQDSDGTIDLVTDVSSLSAPTITSPIIVGEIAIAPSEATTQTLTVTVASKTSEHPYDGGSGNAYVIDGVESPYLTLVPDTTYRFDQANASNDGHPLRFYYESDKTTAYTTGVTASGTPGNAGAYTEIKATASTPTVLFYQCSSHALMGNRVNFDTRNLTGFATSDLVTSGSVTNAMLAGSIANAKLTNSSITINGSAISLGGSVTTTNTMGSGFVLEDGDGTEVTITENKEVKFVEGGGIDINWTDTDNGTDADPYDLTFTIASGGVTNAMLAGSIANSKLSNSSITVSDGSNTTATALGGTITFSGTSSETTVAESSGTITIGLPNDVTVSNDLTVSGNLIVSGNSTITGSTISNTNFTGLSNNNSANSTDFGFYGKYVESSTTKYAGLFFDASTDNTFRLFTDTQTVPSTTVNTGATGYAAADIIIAGLTASSLDISGDADIDGTLEADAITVNGTALNTVIAGVTVTNATNATNSSHVLVTDNEDTNEENLITFVEGATSSTGNVGLEMDGHLTYNPSTGTVSATVFKGNIDAVDGDFDGTLEVDNLTIGGAQGTDGQVLTSTGSGVAWEDASSGGGSGQEITAITANTTLANSDKGKLIQTETSGITITIPALSGLDADWFVDIETINTSTFNHGKVTIDITTNNTGASIGPGGNGTLYGAQRIRLQRSPAGGDAQGQLSAFIQTMLTGGIIVREDRLAGSLQGGDVGVGSIMLGNANNASGNDCIGIGQLVTSNATGSIAIGSYSGGSVTSSATSSGATAIGGAGASGSNGLAMHIMNSSTSYGATNTRSVAIGNLSKASGISSVCISNTSVASGSNSIVIGGASGTASASNSTVIGGSSNIADLDYSIAKGYYGNANGVRGKEAFGNGPGRQRAQYCLSIDTTDDTATVMGVHYYAPTLSAANQLVIPNNTVMAFSGLVTCRQQAADGTDSAAFEVKGLLRREGSASTTTLVTSLINTISNAQSFGVALSANTTLGSLSITVTGAASHDLRWVAQLDTAESTYA